MIGISIANSIGSSSNAVILDPATILFVQNANITNITQIYAINNLVVSLKDEGLWDKMYCVYPFVGGSASSNKYNLIDTSNYKLTFNGGWTHLASGSLPNGVNTYADTNFIPNSIPYPDYESFHISYYSTADTNTNAVDIGVFNPNPFYDQTSIALNYSNTTAYSVNNGSGSISRTFPTTGLFLATVIGVDRKLYRNGINIHSYSGPANLAQPRSVWIAARNNDGEYTDRPVNFSSIGMHLDNSESSIFYGIVQSFLTELGTAV